MCRLAAYAGPPLPLSALIYDAPHALDHQAHSPREMLRGRVNVDGTGVAWWPPEGESGQGSEPQPAAPMRYVSDRPPWADPNLPSLAPRLLAVMALTAVRNATPGVPYGPANTAPFVYGNLACVHNGFVGKFREHTGRELASRLPDHLYAAVDAVSDSLLVFLTFVRHYEADPASGLPAALRGAAAEILEVCADADAPATLNVVVADGQRVAAVRTARGTEGNNPLYRLHGGRLAPGGTLLASEPLDDDPAWESVGDDVILDGDGDGVTSARLHL